MLGKLIKHEWKSVYKMGSLMLLAMLVVTVIGCIVLRMPWIADLFADESTLGEVQSVVLVMTLFVSFMLYLFLVMGVTYGIMIYLGVNFFKSMYTDQGYLTNTLPVTPNQLLISKTLVAGIWYLLIEIAVFLSVFALIFAFAAGMIGSIGGYDMAEFWGMFWEEMSMIFGTEFGGTMVHFMVFAVLTVVISPFSTMIMLFGALTIGQLSSKHKALMGLLTYFGLGIVTTIIVSIMEVIYSIKLSVNSISNPSAIAEMDMMGIYDATLVIQVIMAVILYWVSHKILTKKLNME